MTQHLLSSLLQAPSSVSAEKQRHAQARGGRRQHGLAPVAPGLGTEQGHSRLWPGQLSPEGTSGGGVAGPCLGTEGKPSREGLAAILAGRELGGPRPARPPEAGGAPRQDGVCVRAAVSLAPPPRAVRAHSG